MSSFRTVRKFLGPRWLTEGEGELIGFSLDAVKDAWLERLRLGHLAGFPQQDANGTPGPTDALDALGRDQGVLRGIDETDTSYAYRLTQWLVDARTRGTAFTLMKQLAAYCDYDSTHGCSFRVVDNSGNWFSRAADGTETSSLATGNWDWDGDTASWARFWVIIYPGTRWADNGGTWGDYGDWGDATGTWGSTTITEEQTKTLQASSPEPDGSWGKPYKYTGGIAVASRLATALYLDGTSS